MFLALALSETAVSSANAAVQQPSRWIEIAGVVIGFIITGIIVPLLGKYLASKAALNKASASKENITTKQRISYILKDFALETCQKFNDKYLPTIARRIKDKEITTKKDIKELLYDIGTKARAELVEFGKREGVDMLKTYGADGIKHIIDYAAAKTSPFPGKDTAIELLEGSGADFIIEKGAAFLGNKLGEIK